MMYKPLEWIERFNLFVTEDILTGLKKCGVKFPRAYLVAHPKEFYKLSKVYNELQSTVDRSSEGLRVCGEESTEDQMNDILTAAENDFNGSKLGLVFEWIRNKPACYEIIKVPTGFKTDSSSSCNDIEIIKVNSSKKPAKKPIEENITENVKDKSDDILAELLEEDGRYKIVMDTSIADKSYITKRQYDLYSNTLTVGYKTKEGNEKELIYSCKGIKEKVKPKKWKLNNGILEILLEKE